jgi:myo-inositol-1-phosphate synthase
MKDDIPVDEKAPHDVEKVLRDTKPDMLVCFLPVGSDVATQYYAQACINTKTAFINCMPSFIASDPVWAEKFLRAGVPVAGDDVASQVGTTIIHRIMLWLFKVRGAENVDSWQMNWGGNMDFKNMLDPDRVKSKLESKLAPLLFEAPRSKIVAIPAGYVPFLDDQKHGDMIFHGRIFGGVPIKVKVEVDVDDSPNSAGVVVNKIRMMMRSIEHGRVGYQSWSALCCKHPLEQVELENSKALIERFMNGL